MSEKGNVVYVAGDWVNFHSARETAKFLEQNGYTIAHKWWEPEARQQTSGKMEFLREQMERSDAFVMDIRDVSDGRANAGGHIGMGMAFARNVFWANRCLHCTARAFASQKKACCSN